MISPCRLARSFISSSTLSMVDKSNCTRSRYSCICSSMFARSRCSSYSVSTAEQPRIELVVRDRALVLGGARADALELGEQLLDVQLFVRIGLFGLQNAGVRSTAPNSTSSTSWPSSMRPRRRSSSTSSRRCESAPRRAAPNRPARPFSVWTARKTSLISDGSLMPALIAGSRG